MNKDTYLILTEMKWVFLGCTNSLETQQEGQTRKQNFVEEKGSRLLPQNVLSGEKKKSAKFTPLLFQTLIECKTNKHWNEKRGENTYFMWEKKAQYPLQNKNADFLSLSRSASQQQTLLTASFWADWKHSDYFQRSSPSLVIMFGCNWNLLMGRIHLCFRGGAAQHQQQLFPKAWAHTEFLAMQTHLGALCWVLATSQQVSAAAHLGQAHKAGSMFCRSLLEPLFEGSCPECNCVIEAKKKKII